MNTAGRSQAFVGAHYEVWRPGPTPPAPYDLYAVYHDGGGEPYVTLGWKPTTAEGGSTFSIYRSSTTPVPLDAGHRIASELTGGSYPDFSGQLGDYYVVTAVNPYGESDPSNTAQAKKPGIEGWEGDPAQQTIASDEEAAPGKPALTGDEGAGPQGVDGGGREILSGEEEITKYYFLGSQRVAMREDGDVYYFHTDHLGSTSAMSDGAGNAYGDPVRYLPFGEVRSGDLASLPTDHGFTGQKHNDGVGLIFMQARYYLSGVGRFVSADTIVPDPLNPGSLNRYSYVYNNPLLLVDPSGHGPFTDWLVDVGQRNPVARALIVGASEVVGHVNGQMTKVFYPDANTNSLDRLLACAEIGGGSVLVGVVATEVVAGTLTTAATGEAATAVATATGTAATAACADGDCTNEAVSAGNAAEAGLNAFSRAAEFGIKSFRELRRLTTGTGLQRHHIVEARFADTLGLNKNEMLSLVLTPQEHLEFTNAWRGLIGYYNSSKLLNTITASAQDIWDIARVVYAEYPELLEAARLTIFGNSGG